MYVLSRLVHYFALPEIQWIFAGDWAQMQAHGHWRGQVCGNGLFNGSLSCYLWESYILLEHDFRSQCNILKDYRKRLREADDSLLPQFIEEGRRLFTAPPPYDLSIVISHAKRQRICKKADRNFRKTSLLSNRIIYCDDLGEIAIYVNLSVKSICTNKTIKGLFYKVVCIEPIEVEEQILRRGENEKRILEISDAAFAKECTLACAVTAASVQGDTCEGKVCIADLGSAHMKKPMLEMCAGRARTSANLKFL